MRGGGSESASPAQTEGRGPLRLLRDIVVLGTACFFALMWGLVLREHVRLSPAQHVRPDYASLLPEDRPFRETTMGIYMGNKRIGQTRTVIRRNELGELQIRSRTYFPLGALPRFVRPGADGVDVEFVAELSPLQGLRMMRLFSSALGMNLVGTVAENRLHVRGTVGAQRFETEVPYDVDVFFGQALSPLAGLADLRRAKVGDVWTFQMVNPLLGSVEEVRATVESRREVELNGEPTVLYRLLFCAQNQVWHAWVTEGGEVLVQGTPFGVVLRRDDLSRELLRELGEPLRGKIRRRHW